MQFRGNVQTRLRKLSEGVADGTLLAYAGLRRLGLASIVSELLPLDLFPPAPGQGAICIESRIGDTQAAHMLRPIGHEETAQALACERAFLAALDGSCRTPLAGYATIADGRVSFRGMILSPDGTQSHEVEAEGPADAAAALGTEAGLRVRRQAGPGFFVDWGVSVSQPNAAPQRSGAMAEA